MGRAKAALPFRGGTFLSTVLGSAREAGLDPIVVVLGADGDKILKEHDLSGCLVAWNRRAETGPMVSIEAGLRAINRTVDGIVVWHVDRPHVLSTTVARLVSAFVASDADIALPTYEGRRGHPVLFGRAVFAELLQVPSREGARAVVRRVPSRVLEIESGDPAVLESIDRPEEYRSLVKRYGQ